ncbi:MAG: HDOD domain-containing protein [Betaproteobacteria bacterium]
MTGLGEAIGALHPLPSPRGAALELLRQCADPNASTSSVAHVAQADPALAGRLIHAANVGARGAAPRLGSISAAVLRLGFAATRQIALGFSLVKDYRRGACKGFDYESFWTGSMLRGLAARALAARLGSADPQEALACGLLAEIGRLALATAQPKSYGDLLVQEGPGGPRLRAAERERFAIDHGALGVALLQRWSLPTVLISAVESYFSPPVHATGPDRSVRRMAWTLVLAEAVACAAAGAAGKRQAWTHLALESALQLDVPVGMLDEVAGDVARESAGWAQLLELPVPALVPPGFADYADLPGPEAGAGLRILLVDDDESDCVLGGRTLERAGHEVRLAPGGHEALALIAAAPPQLVITDLDMPRMDGLEFCRLLRSSRLGTDLFVIALTGRERHEDLVDCIHAGANDFVAKSAEPVVLLARVRAAARTVRHFEALHAEMAGLRDLAVGIAIDRDRSGAQARPS